MMHTLEVLGSTLLAALLGALLSNAASSSGSERKVQGNPVKLKSTTPPVTEAPPLAESSEIQSSTEEEPDYDENEDLISEDVVDSSATQMSNLETLSFNDTITFKSIRAGETISQDPSHDASTPVPSTDTTALRSTIAAALTELWITSTTHETFDEATVSIDDVVPEEKQGSGMAGITLTGLRNSDIEGSGGGPGGSMYSGSNTGRKQGSSMVDPDDEEEDVTDSDANVEGSGIAPPPSGGSWRFPMIDPSLVEGSGTRPPDLEFDNRRAPDQPQVPIPTTTPLGDDGIVFSTPESHDDEEKNAINELLGKDAFDSTKTIVPKAKPNNVDLLGQPAMLAAVIGGAVVGLLCAILLVMYLVYRMRKKDEGSYALDEPAKRPGGYMRAPTNSGKEYYA